MADEKPNEWIAGDDGAGQMDMTAPHIVDHSVFAGLTRPEKPKSYRWEPQPDITAYELALCLPALVSIAIPYSQGDRIVQGLPAGARRHFQELDA